MLDNFLMGPQIIFSVDAPGEIKLHKVGLRFAVLEAGVCFWVLNGMKGQIIQRKTAIRGTEENLNYYYYYIFNYFQIMKIKTKIYKNCLIKIYKTNKTTP